jgi:Mn-dependent DtxR family transcriptional regulator
MTNLHPQHLEDLKKSGLSEETIREAGIKTVPPSHIDKRLGFSVRGLVSMYEIPYGGGFSRFKAFYERGRKGPKYLQRKDSSNKLYIPKKVKPILSDSSIPLYITEGEKKALKATQEGLYCVGLSGLWNWSNGNKELISDFDKIALTGRPVYIVPDNDWLQLNKHGYNKNLKQAVYRLAEKLKAKGAEVFIVELPQGDGKGLDDYLRKHSIAEFKNLPAIEVKPLSEKLAEATSDNYKPLLQEIADLDDEVEKELLSKKLAERIGVSYYTVKKTIKTLQRENTQIITSGNIIIAHPAYEINHDFMSLGFRETVVIGDTPTDRNIYLIATEKDFVLCDKSTFQLKEHKVIFNEQNRLLIRLDDRWDKNKLLDFINNPTSPEGVYYEIKQVLSRYVELQKDEIYGLVAAWIIATYFHRCFNAFPFLFVYGKKQSGKSRKLDILERLAFNAMKIKGISVASLTDSIDGVRGTFLNDQAESLSDNRNAELLGILADSYTPGGGKRRIVDISNKKRRVLEFETYSPKAFASIREIDVDLRDRCVLIPMLRTTKDYPYPEAYLPIWRDLRDKLYRLLLTKWRQVIELYQTSGEGVTQRVKELWRPLETVLRLENVSAEEIHAIKRFFLESMLETQTDLSDREEELFEILFKLLEDTEKGVFTVNDIASKLKPDNSTTEKGLQTWVGRKLRQFSLYDRQAGRKNGKRAYAFSLAHVRDVYRRYHLAGGITGDVVENQKDQAFMHDYLRNEADNRGNKVVIDTTSTNEVVISKALKNKDNDYHTTEATGSGDTKVKDGHFDLEHEEIEIIK